MDRNRKRKLYATSVALSLVALAFSLTSFAFVTYSWFAFRRQALINGPEVSVDQGLDYTLKYFVHNEDGGYPAPGYEIINTEVSNYATDFIEIDEEFNNWEDFHILKEPRFRTTFALEVTSYAYSSGATIALTMDGFTAPPSEHHYNYNNGNPEAITLAEAINIYTHATSGDVDNTTITTVANNFVTGTVSNGDQFDNTASRIRLNEFAIPSSANDQLIIFFFTIEFSGDPSTFYKFHSQNNGLQEVYYTKDITGNSNVFQGLGFKINELIIGKEY